MISNYRIYDTKGFMLSDAPSSDDLFCDFEIKLSGKLIQFESVQLKELISLLNKIAETTTYYGIDEYSFELDGKNKQLFKWNRADNRSANHVVKIVSNEIELSKETLWTGHFHGWKDSFYLSLMKDFLDAELLEFAKKYGESFFENHHGIEYKYQIADKVKTSVNGNVKTERIGFIIEKWYHENEQSNMYLLMIDGKKYKKRYFERDIELTN